MSETTTPAAGEAPPPEMSETPAPASKRQRLWSRLGTKPGKRFIVAFITASVLIAAFLLTKPGALSSVLPKTASVADELVIATRSMSFLLISSRSTVLNPLICLQAFLNTKFCVILRIFP